MHVVSGNIFLEILTLLKLKEVLHKLHLNKIYIDFAFTQQTQTIYIYMEYVYRSGFCSN